MGDGSQKCGVHKDEVNCGLHAGYTGAQGIPDYGKCAWIPCQWVEYWTPNRLLFVVVDV